MAGELVRCERCKRHVFAKEAACPFCQAPLGGGRGLAAAVALSAGLSLAGCSREPAPVAVYGGPPPPATVATTAAPPETSAAPPPPAASASTSAKPPPVAVYGGPPPRKPK